MPHSRPARNPVRLASRRRAAVFLLLALAASGAFAVLPRLAGAARDDQAATKTSGLEFVPGEVLVRFNSESKAEERSFAVEELASPEGGRVPVRFERPRGFEVVRGLRLARVPADDTLAAVAALRRRPDVLYAEPNYVRRKLAAPNDTSYATQWSMKNTGQSFGTAGADIDAEAAWDVTTGSRSVVVGVIDEGVDISHPDLQANVWTNPGEVPNNGADDDGDGFVDDVHGWDFFHNDASVYDGQPGDDETDSHGTHVSGIVGAIGNNASGVAGVNWQVSLLPMKILGRDDESPAPSSVLLTVRAYAYAKLLRDTYVSTGGARGANLRVLNNSYGGGASSQAELDAIRALADSGILFVAASGNNGRNNDRLPVFPAAYNEPNVITVAATTRRDQLASFSNYGSRSVHVAAPGDEILSTTPHNTYALASGTSMAAPHVSGAAALVLAANPNASLARLRASLVYNGDLLPELAPVQDFFPSAGVQTGRRLNAAAALSAASEADSTPPAQVSNLHITSQQTRRFTLAWGAPGDDDTTGRASVYEIRYTDADPRADASQFERGYKLLAPLLPAAPGAAQSVTVDVPFRHTNGFLSVRAVDNVGNAGAIAAVAVSVNPDDGDPYIQSLAAPSQLSTGGEALNLKADDKVSEIPYQLPFDFNFFGQTGRGLYVSTNGVLYFADPPRLNDPSRTPDDAFSTTERLKNFRMIAGLWDDLRTDRNAGDDVYVVKPDPTRIIFRWQAVTYATPTGPNTTRGEHPVSFEIELKRDGTIITRYGDGNTNLLPVVGISGGAPDTYVAAMHTSEGAFTNLTNAQTAVFAPRRPTPPPAPDLAVGVTTSPNTGITGHQLTYLIDVSLANSNPIVAEQTVVTTQIPAGTSLVSCSAPSQPCAGPPAGSTSGTLTVNLGNFFGGSGSGVGGTTITLVVNVNAAPGSTLTHTASASSYWQDPNPSNNTVVTTSPVVASPPFDGVRGVSGGGDFNGAFTLAVKTDGTVWAWGDNIQGQLGDGTTSVINSVPSRTHVLSNVTAVEAGGSHALALKSDGTVWGWGNNREGEIGPRVTSFDPYHVTPSRIPISGVTAISAGGVHSLALKADGTLWGWGSNTQGQLGIGSAPETETPLQVQGISNVRAVSAAPNYSVAAKTDGTVWTWGGGFGNNATPAQVVGIGDVASVAAGAGFVLALKSDGTVWAWGSDSDGQLGDGNATVNGGSTPRQVVGLSGVTKVSAGDFHALALKNDGTVWAWGKNSSGQLGDGSTTSRNAPVQVPNVSGATDIGAGNLHSIAALGGGTVRTWGANGRGQLGDRTSIDRNSPVEVGGPFPVATPEFSPDGGAFGSPRFVIISCSTPGAFIHYTLNGADPTEEDPFVTTGGSFLLQTTLTLKARAYKSGWPASPVKSATFTFPATSPTPTPTPVPGAALQQLAVADVPDVNTPAELYLVNADGTGRVNISNAPGDDFAPAWSPDGKQLLFNCQRTPFGPISLERRVCVVDADGTNLRVLTQGFSDESWPAWSPDGKRIAFVAFTGGQNLRIYSMNADGTGRTLVTEGPFLGAPDWSPDGAKIVYPRNNDIWVTTLATGETVRLTSDSGFDRAPHWSPDGTKIVYASNPEGPFFNQYEIFVMNADGTGRTRLTNNTVWDDAPDYSPDGTKIVYANMGSGFVGEASIYVMNADGSNGARVTSGVAASWRTAPAPQGGPHTLQLESSVYAAAENSGRVEIKVTRSGVTTGASSVAYATTGGDASAPCSQANGAASERCDFAPAQGVLDFAPGQTTATIVVPLIDDAFVEGGETFTLTLNSAKGDGASLGSTVTATVTVADDDTSAGASNPSDNSSFFVRQHYLDFLGREPDASGLAFWTNEIESCGTNQQCREVRRINVSAAFFLSIEFQETGYLVERMYKSAYGDTTSPNVEGTVPVLRMQEFLPDTQRVGRGVIVGQGAWQQQLELNKQAYAVEFVQRARFTSAFPSSMTPAQFVDKLRQNTGAALTQAERDQLVNELTSNNTDAGRASVLRKVAEDSDLRSSEKNRAFVLMEYYGYMRRNPNDSPELTLNYAGWKFWLTKLEEFNGNFVRAEMVKAFITSDEYRHRFGQ